MSIYAFEWLNGPPAGFVRLTTEGVCVSDLSEVHVASPPVTEERHEGSGIIIYSNPLLSSSVRKQPLPKYILGGKNMHECESGCSGLLFHGSVHSDSQGQATSEAPSALFLLSICLWILLLLAADETFSAHFNFSVWFYVYFSAFCCNILGKCSLNFLQSKSFSSLLISDSETVGPWKSDNLIKCIFQINLVPPLYTAKSSKSRVPS